MNDHSIAAMRKVYKLQLLLEKDVDANPIKQFKTWWQHAIQSKIDEPNAMALATCTADGKPSVRIVLLKGIEKDGFIFFTNYNSRKAVEIKENGFVSLVFFWKELERQVRIEGSIKKVSAEESDEYFASRPRESKIGAWCSGQSSIIESREYLQENIEKYNLQFPSDDIPRPAFWGGYIVQPYSMEFWQGRPGRLHDRLQYSRNKKGEWILNRLAP